VSDLLRAIRDGLVPNFALLYRPQSGAPDRIDVLAGAVKPVAKVADLPVQHDVLAVVPYRQIVERGLPCRDDGRPILAMTIDVRDRATVDDAMALIGDEPAVLTDEAFDLSDDEYAAIARDVIADEIGRGAGSNFVIRRTFTATVTGFSVRRALAVFRRLLLVEDGAYWTFVVRMGPLTLIGATPERHVTLVDGVAGMTPISGTYRYPLDGPTVEGVLDFLAAEKEIDELHMVVDEELKMMSDVCAGGARLTGPFLRPMARLAHTEYVIEGRTDLDALEVLRRTLLAPTVTGSPLRSACRVIADHERIGRGVYAGALALIEQRNGRRTLDSAIAIRTAEIDPAGRLTIGVGATLVRHSDPTAEAAETRTKAAGLVRAFGPVVPRPSEPMIFADARIGQALAGHAERLSRFWREPATRSGVLAGAKIAIIDAEDGFSHMLARQMRSLGADVEVCGVDRFPPGDVVVFGPGPGDPRDLVDPRITGLRRLTQQCLDAGVPLLAVCLGHQVLADLVGLPLCRNADPAQGLQREIDFFGERLRVGFYNTFSAVADADTVPCPWSASPGGPATLEVSRDAATGQVHGLRGPGVRSTQFHPESVLTEDGPRILSGLLMSLVRRML
jgi:phenazine biosynthesis protein phzE